MPARCASPAQRIDGWRARPDLPRRRRPHVPAGEAVRRAVGDGERHRRRAQCLRRRARGQGESRASDRAAGPRGQARPDGRPRSRCPSASGWRSPARSPRGPRILLLDEVMAGLRPTEMDHMVALFRELNAKLGLTILLIEHVMRAVMALSSRIDRPAPRRGHRRRHARGGDARSGRARMLPRRGGGVMLFPIVVIPAR